MHHFVQRSFGLASVVLAICANSSLRASQIEGYSEPFRVIEVASDETGVIEELHVQLGDTVSQGAPIMRLRSDLYHAQIAVAKQQMSVEGRREAAEAEVELTKLRFDKIRGLRQSGHARTAEVARAENEYRVAVANLKSVEEELQSRQLEHEKLKAHLHRRTLRAPCDGVVTIVHRQSGEFVAPNQPQVITIVQLDQLLANFALMPSQAAKLSHGQSVRVHFSDSNRAVVGTVHFISPITNAESGTIPVQVLVDNSERKLRSGERCTVTIQD
ncbi:efflux RND transporter periplasmic adaptor subunit [Roseiconus lacunae]|uniref:efflux RND transporter periplasmic adaptor subunit n=1 Tax=Roseiconus lacunae TaxID=2605694 RepID=UPI0011F37FB9|nr:efflux RND transporter periplasmic adaptor subunit [Roseiconus lacunae]